MLYQILGKTLKVHHLIHDTTHFVIEAVGILIDITPSLLNHFH